MQECVKQLFDSRDAVVPPAGRPLPRPGPLHFPVGSKVIRNNREANVHADRGGARF